MALTFTTNTMVQWAAVVYEPKWNFCTILVFWKNVICKVQSLRQKTRSPWPRNHRRIPQDIVANKHMYTVSLCSHIQMIGSTRYFLLDQFVSLKPNIYYCSLCIYQPSLRIALFSVYTIVGVQRLWRIFVFTVEMVTTMVIWYTGWSKVLWFRRETHSVSQMS